MTAATVDLVLIELPTHSRHEVEQIAELRRQFPEVKVVVMSGFFGATPPPASRLRAHACIAKPIQPEMLRADRALAPRSAFDTVARRALSRWRSGIF